MNLKGQMVFVSCLNNLREIYDNWARLYDLTAALDDVAEGVQP